MQNLRERTAWAIGVIKEEPSLEKGIRDIDLAKNLGITENTLASYRKAEGSLKGSVLEALVDRYNFNPMWLHKGEGEPFPGARARYREFCGPMIYAPSPSAESIVCDSSGSYDHSVHPEDFVLVSQVNGKISAGHGAIPDDQVDIQVAFRRDWMKRKGNPATMSLIKVSGDSMEPTLLSGDLVLVDHSKTSVAAQGGIYAIYMDGEIMIKRIQVLFPQGRLKIISDNTRYEATEVSADQIRINGKIIWYAREIER